MGASLLKHVHYGTFIGEPKEGETAILRNPMYANRELSQTMAYGCKTILESFEINLKLNRHKCNFLGYRKKIKKDELEKKYTWITYEKADELLTNFSKGLNILNLCPIINIEKEDPFRFLGIYSRNKKEWLLSFLGAIKDSITIVTIYETLGLIAIEFILEQTQLITTVIEVKALKTIYNLALQNKIHKLKNLIVIEKEDDEETCEKLEKLGLNIYSWEEVVEKGKNSKENIILKDNNRKIDQIINTNLEENDNKLYYQLLLPYHNSSKNIKNSLKLWQTHIMSILYLIKMV